MIKKAIYLFLNFFPLLIQSQVDVAKLDIGQKELLVRITVPDGYSSLDSFPVLFGPGLDGGNLEYGCRYFGENPGQYGWILVESSVHLESRRAVAVLLDYIESNYKAGKKFILGFSANSVDAFEIASQYSNKFDGVVAMPGNPNTNDAHMSRELGSQKILMIVGERDTYWKRRAQKAKAVLDQKGIWNQLVIVPKGGHILDEFSGNPLFSLMNNVFFNP